MLGPAVAPESYGADVEALLQDFPDASYLRTDLTCSSLAARGDNGQAIYAVYRWAGRTRESICRAVQDAGGDAYAKRLDTTSDPESVVGC